MTRTGNVVNLAQDADVAVVGGEIMWMAQPVRVNAQYNTEFRIGSILSDVKFVGGWGLDWRGQMFTLRVSNV